MRRCPLFARLRPVYPQKQTFPCLGWTSACDPTRTLCVSQYHYTRKDHEPSEEEKRRRGTRRSFHDLTFVQWLARRYGRWKSGLPRRRHDQWRKVCDQQERLLLDYVGKLESVQADMAAICDKIGIPRLHVPHVNPTRHAHHTKYYDDRSRRMVQEIYERDIEGFGYSFGD